MEDQVLVTGIVAVNKNRGALVRYITTRKYVIPFVNIPKNIRLPQGKETSLIRELLSSTEIPKSWQACLKTIVLLVARLQTL